MSRSLNSFPLSSTLLALLSSKGFESEQDLSSLTPSQLAKGGFILFSRHAVDHSRVLSELGSTNDTALKILKTIKSRSSSPSSSSSTTSSSSSSSSEEKSTTLSAFDLFMKKKHHR